MSYCILIMVVIVTSGALLFGAHYTREKKKQHKREMVKEIIESSRRDRERMNHLKSVLNPSSAAHPRGKSDELTTVTYWALSDTTSHRASSADSSDSSDSGGDSGGGSYD